MKKIGASLFDLVIYSATKLIIVLAQIEKKKYSYLLAKQSKSVRLMFQLIMCRLLLFTSYISVIAQPDVRNWLTFNGNKICNDECARHFVRRFAEMSSTGLCANAQIAHFVSSIMRISCELDETQRHHNQYINGHWRWNAAPIFNPTFNFRKSIHFTLS